MERWAKSQNKKSESIKKLTEEGEGKFKKSSPATADAAFSMIEKKTSEIDRQRALQAAYSSPNTFKKPFAIPNVGFFTH